MSEHFLAGHAQFQKKFFEERSFLQKLAAHGQTPKALYIGCSDSRVVPEYLTDAAIGDLFVIRNIANHVPTFADHDTSVGAAIEYALAHLKVAEVIVCGHYGCGGVKAALSNLDNFQEHQELQGWLRGVQNSVAALTGTAMEADELWRRAVEAHVLSSLANLITFPVVAQALEAGRLHLHGWVYDIYETSLSVYDAETSTWVRAADLARPEQG